MSHWVEACRSMGGRSSSQQSHVLHDQRVHARVVTVPGLLARGFQLGIVQDGVERDVDLRAEAVRVVHQFGDVLDRIARLVARAERRAADVDGVGAVQYGFAADGGGFGGGEEFEGLGVFRHDADYTGGGERPFPSVPAGCRRTIKVRKKRDSAHFAHR